MKLFYKPPCLLLLLIISFSLKAQNNFVSLKQETQSLVKGTKSSFRYQVYYNKEKEIIIKYHSYPSKFISISNQLGETKIYFPDENKVTVQQSQAYSISNELIYYFVNNQISDLGLLKEGFKLVKTTNNEGLIETFWQAPPTIKQINTVKVVFKDMVPIYAQYEGAQGNILKKIYYGRYQDFRYFRLPMRITEISFESKIDSVVRLSVFSDVKISGKRDDPLFNFQIPENATLTK